MPNGWYFVALLSTLGLAAACGGSANGPTGVGNAGEDGSENGSTPGDGSMATGDAGGSTDAHAGHDAANGGDGGSDAQGDAVSPDLCEAAVTHRGNFGCTHLDPCAVPDWTFRQAIGTAPAPVGGNLTPGTYHLVEKVQYGPASALIVPGEGRATLVVDANLVVLSLAAYWTQAAGVPRSLTDQTGGYSVKPATAVDPPILEWKLTCPGNGTVPKVFKATASEIDLYEQASGTTLVSRYVL